MSEMRRVTAICNGTVVDLIPAGRAIQVLRMLRLDIGRSNPISLVMNVPSAKLGRKDVLKIEDRELSQEELDRLALIAPAASISIIRNYSVAEKMQADLGEELVNIARCSFWNCITQNSMSRCLTSCASPTSTPSRSAVPTAGAGRTWTR